MTAKTDLFLKTNSPWARIPGLERGLRMARIIRITTGYIRMIKKIERRSGPLPREVLHGHMIEWAGRMLRILRISVSCQGKPHTAEPVILVGNHISYLDIPLMMSIVPVTFIAKKQLAKWPIFGPAATLVGTVFVDRDSKGSRKNAADAIIPQMKKQRQSVVVFPSGTTSMTEEKPWRWGIFRIAAESGIPVQPFRVRYQPMRRAAYLMEDLFYSHLWNLLDGTPLGANVEFHPPLKIEDIEKEAKRIHDWTREGLEPADL